MGWLNKNIPSPLKQMPGFAIEENRLWQILWVSAAAIAIGLLFQYLRGWTWSSVQISLLITLIMMLVCIGLTRAWYRQLATMLFVVVVTTLACFLIYTAQGMHDQALMILPAVLLFTCMFASDRLYFFVWIGLVLFLAWVTYAHLHGYHQANDKNEVSLGAWVNASLILSASGFFGYVLARDLRKALAELRGSKTALMDINDQLESRVRQRTTEYEDANRALHESMDKLEFAMRELTQAEKLAALGSMVAGISHELNTPIGNIVMAATTMERLFDQARAQMEQGQIKRSTIEKLISEGTEGFAVIARSSQRAASLVTSFKQVAVDQTSEQRRLFDVREVADDIVAAMSPQFKNRQIRVDMQIPRGIQCNSFPGPLGQILTNIIQNAIVHAFDRYREGSLVLSCVDERDHVVLHIRDDGVGMSSHVIAHVFDPFFTTKMGKGGTGLGMSISYRIATSVLGGDLSVESEPNAGTTFTLKLPKMAPYPI